MMKIKFFLIALLFVSCTSCIDIIETLVLNKKGGGVYTVTYDLSRLNDPETLKPLNDLVISIGMEEELNLSELIDSIASQEVAERYPFSEVGGEDMTEEISFLEEIEWIISVKKDPFDFKFEVQKKFNSLNEVSDFTANFDEILQRFADGEFKNLNEEQMKAINSFLNLPGPFSSGKSKLFENNRRELIRYLEPSLGDQGSNFEKQIQSKFFLSLMGTPRYITVYELPKKVKNVSNPNATVEKNTVRVVHDWGVLARGGDNYKISIKY